MPGEADNNKQPPQQPQTSKINTDKLSEKKKNEMGKKKNKSFLTLLKYRFYNSPLYLKRIFAYI